MRGRRAIWSWAFYDWANSAFATTVMAGFFPVFFKQYWAAGLPAADSTFWLGLTNSLASLALVVVAPLLGPRLDRAGRKRRLLFAFTALGVLMTAGLFLVGQGHWPLALLLYALALFGFAGALIPYDALLPGVARGRSPERVSSLGYALGYLGGGLLFALNLAMVLQPHRFGLEDATEAVRLSFLLVALWWALFSVPVLLWVSDEDGKDDEAGGTAWRELRRTWRELRALPHAFTFLLAYWCYIDGVDTVARMAVDFGLSIGLESNDLVGALLLAQLVGFPAALLFGRLGERWGARRVIGLAIVVYMLVVLFSTTMRTIGEFYALAVAIGLVLGGVQALSRALYARLIPAAEAGRFFALYNMMGKFAAVLGPVLVGGLTLVSDSNRTGMLAVLALFVAGGLLLARVDVREGERQAGRRP